MLCSSCRRRLAAVSFTENRATVAGCSRGVDRAGDGRPARADGRVEVRVGADTITIHRLAADWTRSCSPSTPARPGRRPSRVRSATDLSRPRPSSSRGRGAAGRRDARVRSWACSRRSQATHAVRRRRGARSDEGVSVAISRVHRPMIEDHRIGLLALRSGRPVSAVNADGDRRAGRPRAQLVHSGGRVAYLDPRPDPRPRRRRGARRGVLEAAEPARAALEVLRWSSCVATLPDRASGGLHPKTKPNPAPGHVQSSEIAKAAPTGREAGAGVDRQRARWSGPAPGSPRQDSLKKWDGRADLAHTSK